MRELWKLWRTLPRARPYIRPYRKFAVLMFLLTFLGAAFALAEPWPLAIMVDNVLGDHRTSGLLAFFFGEKPDKYAMLIFAVAAGFGVTFATGGVNVLADWAGAKLEQNMVLDLRSDLFNHVQGLSLTFHDNRLTGRLMQQVNESASALGMIVLAFPPIFQALLTLFGMFVVAMLIDWQVALISTAALPLVWYSLNYYGTKIIPRLRRVQGLEWQSLSIVYEAMSMLRVIVSFGRERHEFRRFRTQGETAVNERVKLTVQQTMFSLGVTTATAIGTGLVLGFGALHVLQGKLTVGELLVLVAYIASVYQPLEQISTSVSEMNEQFVAFNSSLDLLDEQKEIEDAPDAIDIGRSTGAVALESVSFAYRRREDTLKDISFDVRPGQRVAIVGPTGAGKTTLMSLLIRFYDPKSGRVLIDGVDIRKLKLSSLREQISVVLQQPLLFSGTIADNIAYGRLGATREDIVEAAKAANAHDFILEQPDGYETVLGEGGAQLSGGERQRIAVARAFIRDAPILILDEPTSSIDSKTESVILEALDDLMVGRTSFMIAHRLSTIREADLILVMHEGQLVEQGSHEELLERGGLYAQLHDAQRRERRRRRHAPFEEQVELAVDATVVDAQSLEETEQSKVNGQPSATREREPEATVSANGDLEVVDLNFADVEELVALPTIRHDDALRIVEHRDRYGFFRSVWELTHLDGFDKNRVREFADRARV